MEIKPVTDDDKAYVLHIDKHRNELGYKYLVYTKSGYVLWKDERRIGLLTYCLLWDSLPFINFLFVEEIYRNQGFGGAAIRAWEKEMKEQGYKMTLLSTRADEGAQHLYRKLGYIDCGGLLFNETPFPQPTELFMRKVL